MKSRLESLQVYRGIAALSVVFYHVGELSLRQFDISFLSNSFSQGSRGVDFFFLLSGFIIFYIHSKDIGKPERAKRYMLKRFFRIYPILFIMISLKLLYMLASHSGAAPVEMTTDTIISGYLMLPPASGRDFVAVAWTLSYEMLFYSIFLCCIILGIRVAIPLLVTWFCAIVVLNITAAGQLGLITAFIFNPINVAFLFGCIAGHIFQMKLLANLRWLFIATGIIGLIIGFEFSDAIEKGLELRLYWAMAFFLVVFGTVNIEQTLQRRAPRFLVTLGDASYSIYLVHASIQAILLKIYLKTDIMNSGYPQLMLLLFGLTSVAGGMVFWYFIERPIQSKSHRFINNYCP